MEAKTLAQTLPDPVEKFIAYWQGREGGQERANYQLFLIGLCQTLGLPIPEASGPDPEANDYVFERSVTFREPDGSTHAGRIDLYRRGCFVLEAKQSRRKDAAMAITGLPDLFVPEAEPRGRRSAARAWDVLMLNAQRQAKDYARAPCPSPTVGRRSSWCATSGTTSSCSPTSPGREKTRRNSTWLLM